MTLPARTIHIMGTIVTRRVYYFPIAVELSDGSAAETTDGKMILALKKE